MTIPNVLITPRRTALLAGHDNDLQVLVRIQAPQAPDGSPSRAPLHLSLVIDRSGSMSGEPLDHAKRCAGFMLDGLTPTDRLSVVSIDEHVTTLSPATLLADKSGVSRAIRDIVAGGMTNLHGGWLQGAETLAPHTSAATISRVILLSDGNANVGIVDAPRILEQCAELANAGVTTSTYGLGRKFNEDLMIGMARHGQGHSYYGSTANDLMDPFREEFALLNATCARYLQLEIDATSGIGVTMLNEYIAAGSATPATAWCLPDLAYGGEAWALVHLRISRDSGRCRPAGGADPREGPLHRPRRGAACDRGRTARPARRQRRGVRCHRRRRARGSARRRDRGRTAPAAGARCRSQRGLGECPRTDRARHEGGRAQSVGTRFDR
jgi:Ca-activated chloride channel family protein